MVSKTVLAIAACGAAILAAAGVAAAKRHKGFFSPVLSPDGQTVYFVQRTSTGLVWGLGLEHFTPPASSYLWSDDFEISRVPIGGGATAAVMRLPESPLVRRKIENYRGRIFGIPRVVLRFNGDALEYEIEVSIPRQPSSETFAAKGALDLSRPPGPAEWRAGGAAMGPGEDSVREPWEVLAVRGQESFPCAVAAHHGVTKELRTLVQEKPCEVTWALLSEFSRRQDISRMRALRQRRESLIARNLSAGSGEGAAILEADRQLAADGYYDKPPQLIATAQTAPPPGAQLVSISEEEFRVGLFQDIEKALSMPGREVEKSMGQYVTHDSFGTSRTLNGLIAGGAREFWVERSGKIYRIVLTERRPAYK